ncbi:MAG: peptidylprolyl isomerase, partial [Pseudomonadota bacterium]
MTQILVDTDEGSFVVELADDDAPATCSYFLDTIRRGLWQDAQVFRVLSADLPEREGEPSISVVQLGLAR